MRPRAAAEVPAEVALPITPMLDMAFQLLFFFIVNFNPSDLEGQLDLSLPSDTDRAAHKAADVRPDSKAGNIEPDLPSDFTVKVRTYQDGSQIGEISAIFVQKLNGKEEAVEGLAGLKKHLKEAQKTVTNLTKENIKIQGDGKLRVQYVLQVMDACRSAGFTNISFVPPEDLGR